MAIANQPENCPICEMPKVHSRLYGYRCGKPDYNQLETDVLLAWYIYPSGDTDGFVDTYPESERDMVKRVLLNDDWELT